MTDALTLQADALIARVHETRFGVAATYTKKGVDVIDPETGAITSADTAVVCTLAPDTLTARDVALLGSTIQGVFSAWIGRKSVLGTGLKPGDQITIGSRSLEVISPVFDDGLAVYRIIAREFV